MLSAPRPALHPGLRPVSRLALGALGALAALAGCYQPFHEDDSAVVIAIRMVPIPAGSFDMGAGAADPDDTYPDHTVTLSHSFWMTRSEITQAAWATWQATNDPAPSGHVDCDDCPVENVTRQGAAMFANDLSVQSGLDVCYTLDGTELAMPAYDCHGFRLPTEAEWEYAARAGHDTKFSGSDLVNKVAWVDMNSDAETHPVCSTPLVENDWQLCDMSGNVREWTGDAYDPDYYALSPAADPAGPDSGSLAVVRGGDYTSATPAAMLAARDTADPGEKAPDLGFRLVQGAE